MSEGQVGEEGEGQEQGEEREGEGEGEGQRVDSVRDACGREREGEKGERETLGEQDRALRLAQPTSPFFPHTSCFGFNMTTLGTLVSNLYPLPPPKACGEATMGIFHGHNIAASFPLPHYHLPLQPLHTHCLLP